MNAAGKCSLPILLVSGLMMVSGSASSQGWFIQDSFLPAQTLQTIRFHDNNIGYTVSSLYNGSTFNIYKTTNGGNVWTAQNSGYTSMRFLSIYIFSPDTVLISGNEGIIVKTTNGGDTWVTSPTGVTEQLWSLDFTGDSVGYSVGSAGRILKTTDAGDSWFVLDSGLQNQFYCVKFLNDSVGYVSGSGIMLRTTDRGDSWVDMNFPSIPPFDELRQVLFIDSLTIYVIADLGRIRKSTDGGVSWTMLNTQTSEPFFGIDFVDSSTGYVCGDHGTIIVTTDGGENWTMQTSGLDEILYGVDFTSPDTGYICTWSGKILKTTDGGGITSVGLPTAELPGEVVLYRNYPNPFNPKTTITFALPASENVILRIFNLLGEEIETLASGQMGSGSYSIEWNAIGQSSGVYFYRLEAGGFIETKKLVVLK